MIYIDDTLHIYIWQTHNQYYTERRGEVENIASKTKKITMSLLSLVQYSTQHSANHGDDTWEWSERHTSRKAGKKERKKEERGKQNTLSADDMTLHRKP